MSVETRRRRFFAFCRDRHTIYLRRQQGLPPRQWTTDPVLRQYHFCNVFRELDRTTVWFRENIREPLRDDPVRVLFATVVFRWFNLIRSGEVMLDSAVGLVRGPQWCPEQLEKRLFSQGPPYVTGAHMLKSPAGYSKVRGLLRCIELVYQKREWLVAQILQHNSLEQTVQLLDAFPYLGTFMSYEMATDLRYTCLLEHAHDINSWASPGAGACRGVARILYDDPARLRYQQRPHREQALVEMQKLLHQSRSPELWPAAWGRWELREVEHAICEFSRYETARLGEGRLKNRYRPQELAA